MGTSTAESEALQYQKNISINFKHKTREEQKKNPQIYYRPENEQISRV